MSGKNKDERRLRRKRSIRKRVSGTADRPRLSVFRSAKHIYAQLVDDGGKRTLVEVSSLSKGVIEATVATPGPEGAAGVAKPLKKVKVAEKVGEILAKVCKERNIEKVAFDRNGYLFHGRVKAVASGARKAGLKF